MDRPYIFSGFVVYADGRRNQVAINVAIPTKTPDSDYCCEIQTNLLSKSPYRVYSGLPHDAWAEAFEVLNLRLRQKSAFLLNEKGERAELPSPPRDRSWVRPPTVPNVEGIEPLYRVTGWATSTGERRPVDLALWPPFEEEPGTFCAPMRCGLMFGGEVRCSYGATPEQSVYLGHKYLRLEVDVRKVVDEAGRPIVIPIPPEPPLPE